MRICIRGTTYETVKEAAKAHNVTIWAIYYALNVGRLDQVGLGTRTPHQNRKLPRWTKPITIAGMSFNSMIEASEALGRRRNHVSSTLREGSERAKEQLYLDFLHLRAKRTMQESARRKLYASPSKRDDL